MLDLGIRGLRKGSCLGSVTTAGSPGEEEEKLIDYCIGENMTMFG